MLLVPTKVKKSILAKDKSQDHKAIELGLYWKGIIKLNLKSTHNACCVAARHEKVADAYSTAPGCKSLLEHYLKINKIRKINNSQQVCWKSWCDAFIVKALLRL